MGDAINAIEDRLWIGSCGARQLVQTHAVEVVIAVLEWDERASFAPTAAAMDYDIELADTSSADLFAALRKLIIILEREHGKRCLVHCMAGISRSAALVVGYLMYRDHVPYATALERVRAARPCVQPNDSFAEKLCGRWPFVQV